MCCCKKIGGTLIFAAGVLFLLQDFKVWDFWGLNWWTVAFLIIGVVKMVKCCCKECAMPEKKRR